MLGLLGSSFARLEAAPLLDIVTKEVIGVNAPRIGLARTKAERLDNLTNEMGNTAALFGGGFALQKVLDVFFKKAKTKPNGVLGANLGTSFALYSMLFSTMWAMPFIRNYVTAKKTGKTDFESVVKRHTAGSENGELSEDTRQKMAKYRKTFTTILGLGLGGIVAGMLGGKLLAKSSKDLSKGVFQTLQTKLGLPGGQFKNFNFWPVILFWITPAYAGWIHASRDKTELKEQLLKYVVSVFGFVGFDRVFKSKIHAKALTEIAEKAKQVLPEFAKDYQKDGIKKLDYSVLKAFNAYEPELAAQGKKLLTQKNIWSMLGSLGVLGVLPLALNLVLRKKRLGTEPTAVLPSFQGGQAGFNQADWMGTSAIERRKSFDTWGQRF